LRRECAGRDPGGSGAARGAPMPACKASVRGKQRLSPVVIRDELPRLVTYPVGEIFLRTHLGAAFNEDEAGLYFLYLSSVQVNLYDPVVSRASAYPVLALDRQPPQLCADALTRLRDQRRRHNAIVDERRAGVLRADAQLHGQDRSVEPLDLDDGLPELPLSIAIFPVKTRLRRRVEDGIVEGALRPLRNWLGALREQQATQRPLVLSFDEESGKVHAKFAEPWEDAKERQYR